MSYWSEQVVYKVSLAATIACMLGNFVDGGGFGCDLLCSFSLRQHITLYNVQKCLMKKLLFVIATRDGIGTVEFWYGDSCKETPPQKKRGMQERLVLHFPKHSCFR